MTIRDIFVVDQLGTEWLMNKFLELCIISLVLNFYRAVYSVHFIYFCDDVAHLSRLGKHKQFICDILDCAIYLFLAIIGMWSILDRNYSTTRFVCMLIYVPFAFNCSVYELCHVSRLLASSSSRQSAILALLAFYYSTVLLSSTIVGLILLRGFFHDYQNLIAS